MLPPLKDHASQPVMGASDSRHDPLRAADLLRRLVDHTHVVLWAIDADGIITLSEGRGLEALGLQPGQIVGDSVWDMYADHPQASSVLRRALAGQEVNQVVEVGPTCFETWVQPLRDAQGQVIGAVGVSTDVTPRIQAERELKKANEQLAESVRIQNELLERTSRSLEEQIHERRRTYLELERSEARWRSLVEEAPDVILQLNREGLIEYINHPIPRDTRTVDEIRGHPAADFLFPASLPPLQRGLQDVFEHGRSVTLEVSGPSAEREVCWYQAHLAPVRHEGEVVSATVVVRDVTDQRQAKSELERKQDELAHVGRVSMVGEMTASFAHELNQPLAAIAHYIAGCVIRLQKDGRAGPDVLGTLQEAAQEARRASEIVRRLRLFLQKHEMQREPANLNHVVRDAERLMEFAVRNHAVPLEIKLAKKLPTVFIDSVQIMQVLLNLVLNAAEAQAETPANRRQITVETRQTNAGEVICSVRDRGPGLPQALPHDIFDAFITTKPDGLGLGLSISRSIMQAHGGSIRAETAPDGGAEFILVFPKVASEGKS